MLDEAPNDISVVQGIITEEFQTPLSHVNVLSQNRKTPNMGLRNAMSTPSARAGAAGRAHPVAASGASATSPSRGRGVLGGAQARARHAPRSWI